MYLGNERSARRIEWLLNGGASGGRRGSDDVQASWMSCRWRRLRGRRPGATVLEIELLENGGAEALTRSGQRLLVSRRYLRDIKDRLHII